jgi:predicted NAD/FAD-dependent oxidoreductase
MKKYDLIIIGSGPSGLAFAQCAAESNLKVLIIEKESVIGGCHKVHRIDYNNEKLFSEHGPRVYSDSYLNFKTLLHNMGEKFEDLFTPYNFNFTTIGGVSVKKMHYSEIFKFVIEFLKFSINPTYSKTISVLQFSKNNNFSKETIDYLDAVCRLTDGANSDTYTLFQFLNLIDQQTFYKLYQPLKCTDKGLLKYWETYLLSKNVEIQLNTTVTSVKKTGDKIVSLNVGYIDAFGLEKTRNYEAKEFFFAIPPVSLVKLLEDISLPNIFGKELKDYSKQTEYIGYTSIVFHFDKKIKIPKIWGLPKNDWGVGFIISTDYTKFDEKSSKTVISAVITKTMSISKYTHKTSSNSSNLEKINEVFRQLEIDLPLPTFSYIYPLQEEAFVENVYSQKSLYTIPYRSTVFSNLYSIGTHNKNAEYHFTSLESAVTNSIVLAKKLYPEIKNKYPNKYLFTISKLLYAIIAIIAIIIVIDIYSN